MNDEVIGTSVDLHLLKSVLVVLASRTVPFVISGQGFFTAEPIKAVVD